MATPQQNRILIVDDDPSIRGLMARHFRRRGFQVEQAEAAEEVLERFGADLPQFDVVLTDVHLPGQSGVDLARRIKEVQPEQPVVFMTGDADAAIARQALKSGASSFLLKPFQFFEIDTSVRNAVQRKAVHVGVFAGTVRSPKRRRRVSVSARVRVAAVIAVMLALGWIAGAGLDSGPADDSAEVIERAAGTTASSKTTVQR